MPNLIDIITDYFPANADIGVPLLSTITITFDQLMDETRLSEDFFIEGPDTDQFIGPGLIHLSRPDNLSQGDLDDFLTSPGYKGIVEGAFDFDLSTSGINTVMRFTPTRPLAASTEYIATLTDTQNASAVDYTGHLIFTWTTGTGSIVAIPSNVSSSVLSATVSTAVSAAVIEGAGSTTFGILSVTPGDRTVENSVDLSEIVITFNKNIDESTLTDKISITSNPVTNHPNASNNESYTLAKALSVSGNKLTIRI